MYYCVVWHWLDGDSITDVVVAPSGWDAMEQVRKRAWLASGEKAPPRERDTEWQLDCVVGTVMPMYVEFNTERGWAQ